MSSRRGLTNAQLIGITSFALQAYLIATTILNVWHSTRPIAASSEHRSLITAQTELARTHNEIVPQNRFDPSAVRISVEPTAGGRREGEPSTISIRDYMEENTDIVLKKYMAIVSWNSSGLLETDKLCQQCAFRNNTQAATWPYLLDKRTLPPSPHGVIALLTTTDYAGYDNLNWTVKSPLPILTFTVPVDAVQNPWVRLIPTPYELKGGARMAVGSTSLHLVSFKERYPIIMYRGNIQMNQEIRRIAFEMAKTSPWLNATQNYIRKEEMVRYRYLLDIGGISGTTWIALRWKMCSGSLVFKVNNPMPTMDWWHGTIQPWKHYVPVRHDLSDLHTSWKWAQEHQDEAFAIAEAGKLACKATLSKESQDAAVDKALQSLPPASLSQRKELSVILSSSSRRLEKGLPPLMFLDEFHPNPGKKFHCP